MRALHGLCGYDIGLVRGVPVRLIHAAYAAFTTADADASATNANVHGASVTARDP